MGAAYVSIRLSALCQQEILVMESKMAQRQAQRHPLLYSVADASQQLGDVSIWTLRKHVQQGNIRPTRLGRRIFISSDEIARIQQAGLPSLKQH
jgi:hypothetical protein